MSKRKQIIKLLNQGVKIKDICKKLNVSKTYVYSVKYQLKEQKRKKEYRKQKLKKSNLLELKCKKCKKTFLIRVNNLDVYTEDIISNWVCLNCSAKKLDK